MVAVRRALIAIEVFVGMMVLLMPARTVWFRGAVAALCFASVPRQLAMDPLLRGRLSYIAAIRLWAIMLMMSGVFGCIASLLAGGAISWLGVFLSLPFAVTGAWLLRQLVSQTTPLEKK